MSLLYTMYTDMISKHFTIFSYVVISLIYTSFEKSFESISEEIEQSIENTGEFKCGKIFFTEII